MSGNFLLNWWKPLFFLYSFFLRRSVLSNVLKQVYIYEQFLSKCRWVAPKLDCCKKKYSCYAYHSKNLSIGFVDLPFTLWHPKHITLLGLYIKRTSAICLRSRELGERYSWKSVPWRHAYTCNTVTTASDAFELHIHCCNKIKLIPICCLCN